MTTDPFAAVSAGANGSTATADPFGQKPSEIKTSDFPTMDDLNGRLLVIQPSKLETGLPNPLGKPGDTRDRITADVTVIDTDSPEKSVTHRDMYLSQGSLIGQTKNLIETRGMLLGVLRRHRAKNTPEGFNTPDEVDKMITDWVAGGARGSKPMFAWKLADFSEAEKASALTWYRSKTS